ncbi:MAG: GtrA family protein [Syntrophobacteraceae bacterium]|nr:GtrA family protein [Syntrophobacteraceae bacterium]
MESGLFTAFFSGLWSRLIQRPIGKRDALFHQLWRFACVGALATVIHFSVLIFLVQVFGFDPVASSVAGFLTSVCFNYYLNYKVTFKSTNAHGKTMIMFCIISGAGLLLNTFIMSLCIGKLQLRYISAQVFTTGCVFVWNFTVHRQWTFRPAGSTGAGSAPFNKRAGRKV